MKKTFFILVFISSIKISFAQSDPEAKKCYSLVGAWHSDDDYYNGYIIAHDLTESDCAKKLAGYKPHKSIYGNITYTWDKPCVCEEIKHKSPGSANNNNGQSKKEIPSSPIKPTRKKLSPEQTHPINSAIGVVENGKDQLAEQHKVQNERDAGKFAGNRPSSSENFGLKQDDFMTGIDEVTDVNKMIGNSLNNERNDFPGVTSIPLGSIDQNGNSINGIVVSQPDGSNIYAYDTNGDKRLDSYEVKDIDGQIINNSEVSFDTNYKESSKSQYSLDWIYQMKNQGVKPGEDGFTTHFQYEDQSVLDGSTPRNYYVNGVFTDYSRGYSSVEEMSNVSGHNFEWVHNQTAGENPLDKSVDLAEAQLAYKGLQTPVTDQMARLIALDLASDKDVRLFAHSEGAAFAYSSVNSIKSELHNIGIPESKMQNLSIITLGGYSPPTNNWPSGANVINVENNFDLVPILAGNSKNPTFFPVASIREHGIENYYQWIKIFSDPNLNLKPYFGNQYNSSDLMLFK